MAKTGISEPQDIKDVYQQLKVLDEQMITKDVVNGLPALVTGTITTGDPTTDTILVSILNRVEKLIENIGNQ